ncbi:DUF2207 domain-containing protein [Sphingomonas lutea]|uniref:DUF2207 domain-containing protein n=1 Tax=Sphingomonas lutea TaxID=1045317 RepID=A0A7G9SFN2_9SPHN|nr:DUF2207 domain-containing protein [Sphingomonas lutea]QNN66657.1 DUF2207 domain-containing protein [Sphingomonas lutea]
MLFAPFSAANAEERITHFVSDVRIQPDSSIEVTETIEVRAERDAINHGIYRDFPTRYRGRHGGFVRVGFTFHGATLDGQAVPAAVEAFGNGVRIKLGDPEEYVDVGDHRYVLRYRTTRQIGRFGDYDELYWNATGNGWMLPIDTAEARIRLPGAVRFGQRAAYTGPAGASGSDAEVVDERPGEIAFRTTRSLAPYEGLTIAVAFPKGAVAEANSGSRLASWLADNGPPLVGGLSFLGLLAFYYVAWARVGRDPRKGTVVPLFAPPDDLSPAAMRYVTRMGLDNRAFAAALVDMGVRGHIRMTEVEGGLLSRERRRIERLPSASPLPADEAAALEALLDPGETIFMEQANHGKFSSAKKGLEEVLQSAHQGRLFNKNWGWAVAGALLLIAALWLVAASIVAAMGLDVTMVLVPLGAAIVVALLLWWIQSATAVGKCLAIVIAFVFAALAFTTGAPVLFQALATGWLLPFALPALTLPLVLSAFAWIDAPTKEGRAVLDRIAGFKQYLSITEGERLDRMHPPEADTPELFEKYLPYAVALGVENRWADRFAGVLAAAAARGHSGMAWYSGSHSPWSDPGGFADSIGSSLTNSISSASTAPGSRSGSGGGGSSGGGDGGGGGGGW